MDAPACRLTCEICYRSVTFQRIPPVIIAVEWPRFCEPGAPPEDIVVQNIILSLVAVLSLPLVAAIAQSPSPLELRKQAELAGRTARDYLSNEEISALIADLKSPDAKVRQNAVGKLRLVARRVDKSGGQRIQRGDVFDPKVE